MKRGATPANTDAYLAAVPKDARDALEKLRKIIRAAAPKATETISYQIPTYKYHGMLVSFAASKTTAASSPALPSSRLTRANSSPTALPRGPSAFQPTSRFPPRW